MSEFDRSSAAATPRDLVWSTILRVQDRLNKENMLTPDPASPGKTREQIFAEWLNTVEGAALYAEWQNASDVAIKKLQDLPVVGPIAEVVDGLIAAGGQEIRKADPALTKAQSIDAFLKTEDGKQLYQLGASLPSGATFEGSPKAVRRACGLVRDSVISKRADFTKTPLTMKLSALLLAVAKKS